jgi:hypothetical protein
VFLGKRKDGTLTSMQLGSAADDVQAALTAWRELAD